MVFLFSICCSDLRGLFQTAKIRNIVKCEQIFWTKLSKTHISYVISGIFGVGQTEIRNWENISLAEI